MKDMKRGIDIPRLRTVELRRLIKLSTRNNSNVLLSRRTKPILSSSSSPSIKDSSTNYVNKTQILVVRHANELWQRRNLRCIVYLSDLDLSVPAPENTPVITLADGNGTEHLLKIVYEQGCSAFIVRASSYQRQSVIKKLIQGYKKSLYARYNDKLYLFLPENDNDNDTSFLDTIDMFYMPNLVFLVRSGNEYHAVGHNYFHGCKYDVLNVKHEIIDTWDLGNGFKYNKNLYPDKLSNLCGKAIRLSLLDYKPYSLVANDSNGVLFDGLETRVAVEFARSINATWIGLDNPFDLWGELFDNGTGTGIFGTVLEHEADIGFSAIYQWYCDVLECSRPYVHSDVTCLAPKPEILSGWLTIILPFENRVWLVFVSCFALSGLFSGFFLSMWRKITGKGIVSPCCSGLYHVLRLHLQQFPSSITGPLVTFYKILGLYSFFIAIFWQGGISSFLTVPRYEKPINEPRDLVERYPALHWGANHIAWVESIKDSQDPIFDVLVDKFVVEDAPALKERVRKKDFAYFIERLQNGHYALNSYIDEDGMRYLRIMEKNIYGGYVVMILTRGSPYLEKLDEILIRMFDTGLVMKIEFQMALERTNNKLQNMIRSSAEKPGKIPTSLKVHHILGSLYIYAFGIVISVIVFAAEMKYFKAREEKIRF